MSKGLQTGILKTIRVKSRFSNGTGTLVVTDFLIFLKTSETRCLHLSVGRKELKGENVYELEKDQSGSCRLYRLNGGNVKNEQRTQ